MRKVLVAVISALSDDDLRSQTSRLRERLGNGQPLDDLLVEAFAATREAAKRTLGQRHSRVSSGMVMGITMAGAILAGCAQTSQVNAPPPLPSPELTAYLADKPLALHDHFARIKTQEPGSEVLNNLELGRVAMGIGENAIAEKAFDDALLQIESVFSDNEKAAKARSLWHSERVKDFKGEPHERLMAYYYRGILYLMRGDYENAQATFRGAALQTTFAEGERHKAASAMATWLEGWSNRCMGESQADERFKEALAIRPDLPTPQAGQNWLVIADTGTGPTKETSGKYNQILKFKEGVDLKEPLTARVGTNTAPMVAIEDVYLQSITRDGRPIDAILAGKAAFKDSAADVAATATMARIAMANSGNRYAQIAAIALMAVSAGAKIAEASANPTADARTWTTLPHSVLLAPVWPPTDNPKATGEVVDAFGRPVTMAGKSPRIGGDARCHVAWLPSTDVVVLPPILPTTVTGHATEAMQKKAASQQVAIVTPTSPTATATADEIRKAADQGDAKSQNKLGDMYAIGLGVTQDYAEAVKWYRKAANQGDANGQNKLGTMYHVGLGVTQDYAEAVKWYRKAAKGGNKDAQSQLKAAGVGVE